MYYIIVSKIFQLPILGNYPNINENNFYDFEYSNISPTRWSLKWKNAAVNGG